MLLCTVFLYKHAVSTCMNYVYRQNYTPMGLLDCFHVAFFFSAASSTEEKRSCVMRNRNLNMVYRYVAYLKKITRSYNFQQRKQEPTFIKIPKRKLLYCLHLIYIDSALSMGIFWTWAQIPDAYQDIY